MLQKAAMLVLVAVLVLAGVGPMAQAQEADGWTTYQVNMRSGPGTNYRVVTTLAAGSNLFFEARNGDISWLLARTADGTQRGWVAALYVGLRAGYGSLANLPISDEITAIPAAAESAAAASAPDVSFDPAAVGSLDVLPVVPAIGPRVYEIYARGQALGNNPRVFAKVGDCNTASPAFMVFFGQGYYTLGAYQSLQTTIDFFSAPPAPGIANSFVNDSAAAHAGFVTSALLDPAWSDPARCPAGTSPLECEYGRIRPSVALIMLGLSDTHMIDITAYEQGLRGIVAYSIDQGVIPVLTTFPTWAGENDGVTLNKRLQMNQIVVNLSNEYGIPLINFWQAAQSLPMSGMEGDLLHLSYSGTAWMSFAGDEQQWGFTEWNLIVLQTLEVLRVNVLER